MTSNPVYIFGLLIDSFIAFFSWVIIVEIFMNLFQIKKHRIRSFLRLAPFVNLIIDFSFHKYSIASWLNPLSCSSCVQKFILEHFYPHLETYLTTNQISLIRYLGIEHQHIAFSILMVFCGTASTYFAARYLIQIYQQTTHIKSIIKNSVLSSRPTHSIRLAQQLYKHKINLYISEEINIPCATFNKIIIIPKNAVDQLSQSEFEAVVAHELEHIIYKDPLIRLLYHCVAILFWWVPTNSWIKKIEDEQELACDQNVFSYGIANDAIALALVKIAKQSKTNREALCYFANEKNLITTRIKTLLGLNSNIPKITSLHICFGSIGIIFLLACLIK